LCLSNHKVSNVYRYTVRTQFIYTHLILYSGTYIRRRSLMDNFTAVG